MTMSADGESRPAGAETRLPYPFARTHGVLLTADDRILYGQDTRIETLLETRRALNRPLRYTLVDKDRFEQQLQQVYADETGGSGSLIEAMKEVPDLNEVAEQLAQRAELLNGDDEAPIVRLLNALLAEAIREQASDIHIDAFEQRLVIRMRIDGVLREVLEPPNNLAAQIVSRLKVMARLDIAEKRLPQDGRISLQIANRPVDVRLSTMPAGQGERVVLRLLDKQAGRLRLPDLGLDETRVKSFNALIHKPHGIILVTGPTGSGKTTTLYASLAEINDQSRNIMTIEDPIEYYLDGIAQSQVNNKVGLSFAQGLRAMLRQDPDVVMVGEIRDLETAQVAIQASLTGHMVLSTLHTNTAIGAVTRLRDMGVEPFLLASSLLAVLSQRLVRKLCTECRRPRALTAEEARALKLPGDGDYHQAVGCEACRDTGYRGRTTIHELLTLDPALQQLIHQQAPEQDLMALARQQDPGLLSCGLAKAAAGITSVEEILRVTRTD